MNKGMKRTHSPSLSDEDDFSDDGGRMCSVVTGSTEHHHPGGSTRKRRRGVIEKRRRDRINTSLNELKRLVPSALEKSGSAKLEKAEILQMTVDYLKVLHARGATSDLAAANCYGGDPHRFAADYHGVGFRECAGEVARYLSSVEGMDVQDPMRLRLMSHLQMFASSRAATVYHHSQQQQQQQQHLQQHQPTTTTSLSSSTPPTWSTYTPPNSSYTPPSSLDPKCLDTTSSSSAVVDPLTGYFVNSGTNPAPPTAATTQASLTHNPASSTSPIQTNSTSASASIPTPVSSSVQANLYNSYTHFSSPYNSSVPPVVSTPPSGQYPAHPNAGSTKPYRPWGAEMAC